jgi:galactose-1-phosphate uridylyltransferase
MRAEVQRMFYIMPDGTIKQINPFTRTEVWTVPGRGMKPLTNEIPQGARRIERRVPEDYCNFCEANHFITPPEKSRLVSTAKGYELLEHLPAAEYRNTRPLFRRVPNLFEIVTADYWRLNHGYELSPRNRRWKQEYLATEDGFNHVRNILLLKLRLLGHTEDRLQALSRQDVYNMSDAFFGGGHELIVAGRHYSDGAEYDVQLCSSGELSPEEHAEYFRFTIQATNDIYANNRYVRYVSVFQNWLAPAGASFDHLHKQLVALDEWGVSVEEEIDMVRNNPNIYNEQVVNFAAYSNFTFAENDHAIALADVGHRYPTVAVYSKSAHARPIEHDDRELRGFSDLVHAVHAAMGPQIACNEEWYYTPRDAVVKMPWHILIKWRTNNPAGFEGGTKIYINPVSPIALRDKMVPRLYELRNAKKIAPFRIAEECELVPNCLKYHSSP